MVKLTRIVKKSLIKQISKKDSSTDTSRDESHSSRGKAQPYIDFNNLPTYEDVKNKKKEFESVVSSKNQKKLLKVNKGKQFKKSTRKLDRKLIKSKINGLFHENKNNININDLNQSHLDDDININKSENTNLNNKEDSPVLNVNNSIMSRGKRKRELKKDAWRRKNQFTKEAKRIVEQFQKEIKYGKALGNLSVIKNQMELIEESMRLKKEKESKMTKVRSKISKKSLMNSKRIFNIATKNL
uniref:Uncharacterized protein n=1 Tax=Theileria annulata TaxID=5874 RepID=A0A3B0N5T0_THEAN